MEKMLSVGKVLNFHGIQGEVKVGYTAGREGVIESAKEFVAVKDNKTFKLTVESVRFHKGCALIKFKEINSINDSNEIKGAYLKLGKEIISESLEEDEFYINDLVGLDCFDTENNFIGKISSVITMGSEDLLMVKDADDKENMVPFVKALVPEVMIKEKKVIINKIQGLIE